MKEHTGKVGPRILGWDPKVKLQGGMLGWGPMVGP